MRGYTGYSARAVVFVFLSTTAFGTRPAATTFTNETITEGPILVPKQNFIGGQGIEELKQALDTVEIDFGPQSLREKVEKILEDYEKITIQERIEALVDTFFKKVRSNMSTRTDLELGLWLIRDVIVSIVDKANDARKELKDGIRLHSTDFSCEISWGRSSKLSMGGTPMMSSTANYTSEPGLLIHIMFKAEQVRENTVFFTMLTTTESAGSISLSPNDLDGFFACGEVRNENLPTTLCAQPAASCVCSLSPSDRAPVIYAGTVTPWILYLSQSSDAFVLIQRIMEMEEREENFGVEKVLNTLKEPFLRLLASDKSGAHANILVGFFFSKIVHPRTEENWATSLEILLKFCGDILYPQLYEVRLPDQVLKLSTMSVSLSQTGTSVLDGIKISTETSEPLLHIELNLEIPPLDLLKNELVRLVWAKAMTPKKTVSFPLRNELNPRIPICASFNNLSEIKKPEGIITSRYTDTDVTCSTESLFIGVIPKELESDLPEITFDGNSVDRLRSLTALFRRFGSLKLRFFESRFLKDILRILEKELDTEAPKWNTVEMVYEEIILPALELAGTFEEIARVHSFSIDVTNLVRENARPNIKIARGLCNLALSNERTSLLFTTVNTNGTSTKSIHHAELRLKNFTSLDYEGPLVLVNADRETNYTVSFQIESTEGIHICGSFDPPPDSKKPTFTTTRCHTLSFANEISCVCPAQKFIGIKQVPYAEAINNARKLEDLTRIGKLIYERENKSFVEQCYKPMQIALGKHLSSASQGSLENLVSELLLPDLHRNEAGIEKSSFDHILGLLLSVVQQKKIRPRSFSSLGLSINIADSNDSKLETTRLQIENPNRENRLIHLEIDASAFPGVFQTILNEKFNRTNLISKLLVFDSKNLSDFTVEFETRSVDDTPTYLASCFSMYEGNLDTGTCETHNFMSSRVFCKCTFMNSTTFIGVHHQDFNTVLGELQQVRQLTSLLEAVHRRHGDPQAMYQEFSPMLERATQIINSEKDLLRTSRPLIDFAQVTNKIFNIIFKNVKTIRNALEEVYSLHDAYNVFMDLGLNPEEPTFFEMEHLSIAFAQRNSGSNNSSSIRNTTVRFTGEDSAVPVFAHVVIDRSLYRDTVLPQYPDAERSLTDLVHVVSLGEESPSVEFSHVPHPPDAKVQCGVLRDTGPNRKKCATKLKGNDVNGTDLFTVECECRETGPHMVLATPFDVIMEETSSLASLLNFTSLLYPKNDTDLVWRYERTLLKRLKEHLKEIERNLPTQRSEILEPFIHMFESRINNVTDIQKIFGVFETVEVSVRGLLTMVEEGKSGGDAENVILVGKRPKPSSQNVTKGLTASFPSVNVTDIDGKDRKSFWLYIELKKALPVYEGLMKQGGNPTFMPCSPLLNVYGDFAMRNLAIQTECSNRDLKTELRCARLNIHGSSGTKLFTTDGCRTNSLNGDVVHCDCTAPGPYIVFAIPRRDLFNMETNSTAVVALAEHFVKQHYGIGPLVESQSSFFKRLETITTSSSANAEEAMRAFSSRLLPEILFRSSNKSFETLMDFSREFTLELSKHLVAPVNSSNSLIAYYVGRVTTTNHTIPLSSMSLSHPGKEDDYTMFRQLPRQYVTYLDEKLVSDIVDVGGGADRPQKPSLDLVFEMNPRFRREKHLPRCVRLPETDPPSCITLEISENVVCRCKGPGIFGIVLRDFAHIAERFLDIEMMIRDSKWILSHSLESLVEVKESFRKGLKGSRERISDGGEPQSVQRVTPSDAVPRALYEQLLPAFLDRAENVANFSAVLNFLRDLHHDSVQSAESLRKYLTLKEPLSLSDTGFSIKSSIVLLPESAVNIPASRLERFGLNNESVALTTDLREVILPSSGGEKIIVKFVDFRRVRHGDVKCVWFDTTNRYFDANGCEIQKRNGTELVCQCDQPRAVGVVVVPFESYLMLNVFSAIAITINSLCLTVCVSLLYHIPKDHSLRCLFRFHQCSALLLGQGILIASTATVQSAPVFEPCNALVGFLLQFSFLVAATFIGFEAIEVLKQSFLMSLAPPTSGRKRFIFLGYGIPLLIAALCFGLESTYLGSYQLCFVEHKGHLLWLSAIPFVVTVGLSLLAAVAALLRLACLGEDKKENHASRLRSYAASTALLALIVSTQWAPAHLVQIEDTGLSMAFLFFFTTLLQGPILLFLFVVYSVPDRKAMARGLARGETKLNNILADLVRPPPVSGKVETDERRQRSFQDTSSRTDSVSITRLEPLELRRFSEAPVV